MKETENKATDFSITNLEKVYEKEGGSRRGGQVKNSTPYLNVIANSFSYNWNLGTYNNTIYRVFLGQMMNIHTKVAQIKQKQLSELHLVWKFVSLSWSIQNISKFEYILWDCLIMKSWKHTKLYKLRIIYFCQKLCPLHCWDWISGGIIRLQQKPDGFNNKYTVFRCMHFCHICEQCHMCNTYIYVVAHPLLNWKTKCAEFFMQNSFFTKHVLKTVKKLFVFKTEIVYFTTNMSNSHLKGECRKKNKSEMVYLASNFWTIFFTSHPSQK